MININTNELRLYEARLNQLNEKGLRIARNESVNDTAFKAKELAKKKIEQDFTIRNNYTLKNSNNPVQKAYGNRTYAEFGTKLIQWLSRKKAIRSSLEAYLARARQQQPHPKRLRALLVRQTSVIKRSRHPFKEES